MRAVRGLAILATVALSSAVAAAQPSPQASGKPSPSPKPSASAKPLAHGKPKGHVSSAEATQAQNDVSAGKYAAAKRVALARIAADPHDSDAYEALAAADEGLHDHLGASNAFDRSGYVSVEYRRVAARAFAGVANNALAARHFARAVDYAGRALGFETSVQTLYLRATAWAGLLRYAPAITDYESAKALAKQTGTSNSMMDAIDAGLATAYIFGGQTQRGTELAAEYKARNPGSTRTDDAIVDFYTQASIAALRQGKPEESIADLETAANLVPASAVALYLRSSNVMMTLRPVDWKRVKGEADKALAISPNEPHANFTAAVALEKSGDMNDAISYLQTAKANVSGDPIFAGQIDDALRTITGH